MKTQMRLGSIGVVLIGCAMALACVRYVYQGPAPTRTEVTETEVVAPADGSDQPFYDDLAPYGRWVYVTGPGWVWSPEGIQAGWRPYQLGHWVFTDQGWTWASDEQWGWAAYHYGRWHQDRSYGWVWVPGTEWGPAWVAWHEGGGYVGWAPLPWQVRFRAGVGLDWGRVNVTIAPASWCFVSARNLVDPVLWTHIVPTSRNVNLIQVTKNVTNYTYIDNRVVNRSVKVESIVRASGRAIPHYRVADTDSPETARGGKVRGRDFVVFRPNPGRGHTSRGHRIPPGHDESRHPGDYRQSTPQTEPARMETPAEATPPNQAEAPPKETESRPVRHERPASDSDPKSRGRRVFDQLKGRPSPHRSPEKAAPSQPAPSQPAPPDQQSAPTAPAEAKPGNPPAGDGQSATTPPAKPAPAKSQPASRVGKGRKSADEKSRKPKQDTAKSEESEKDKQETEKPDSGE